MLSLNLVYQQNSQIEYKISKFPDGQQDITILSDVTKLQSQSIRIESRFNSFKDLELFICAANALRRMGVKERHLYIPYLLGARSDRQFVTGGNSYLVDIIAPQLNQTVKEIDGEVRNLFSSVTVMDVHSDVAPACINNLKIIDNKDLIMYAWDFLNEKNGGCWKQPIVLSPDGGALKKIYKVTEKIGFTGNVITCSKFRDTDGKLSMTYVPLNVHDVDKDLVIIDDIGDGFGTFINLVEEIENTRRISSVIHPENYGKIYLIVTHSIQEKGLKRALEKFNYIFTTNSVNDWKHDNLIVMNVF